MTTWLLTEPLAPAPFADRPNRFVVRYRGRGRRARAFLANPGRLREILLPGVTLLLASRPHTRTGREVVGAAWRRRWPGDRPRRLFLNTSRLNDLVAALLRAEVLPPWRGFRLLRREVPVDGHRLDFLLADRRGPYFLEVKSVTFVEEGLALFPDAVTLRGRRHLETLARGGRRGGVLFVVQGRARAFLPDAHTDLAFARTLYRLRRRLDCFAVRLEPVLTGEGRLRFAGSPTPLPIPWARLAPQLADGGLYLLVLRLPRRRRLAVGRLGSLVFPAGHYVYVGAARRGLTARLARHRRRRRPGPYHVDALLAAARLEEAHPLRGLTGECRLAAAVARLGERLPRFGASDCRCAGHLVRLGRPPHADPAFQRLLVRLRTVGLQ